MYSRSMPCRRLASSCGRRSARIGPVDRHLHGAVVGDRDVVGLDPFLALHAGTIGDPELPVVPRAGDQVAVELALGQAVALVRTGVVDGVQAVAGADEAHAVAVDLDHLHGADGEVVEVKVGGRVSRLRVASMSVHGKTSTMVEVKDESRRTFSVGEVAARSGVATSALRFYEANGLIVSERTEAGHRRYAADVMRRVGFIKVAQRVGLSLGEIKAALDSLPSSRTPNRRELGEARRIVAADPRRAHRAARIDEGEARRVHRLRLSQPRHLRVVQPRRRRRRSRSRPPLPPRRLPRHLTLSTPQAPVCVAERVDRVIRNVTQTGWGVPSVRCDVDGCPDVTQGCQLVGVRWGGASAGWCATRRRGRGARRRRRGRSARGRSRRRP